jgi:hypothetical protein
MIWDDVKFIVVMTVLGFLFPFTIISGFITADYVICDKMNACGAIEKRYSK